MKEKVGKLPKEVLNMKQLLKLSLIMYTGVVGLMFVLAILLKSSSSNKNYYALSFKLFLVFLAATFISLLLFQTIKKKRSKAKEFFRYASIGLILLGIAVQAFWALDLYKEKIASRQDMIAGLLYIAFIVLGIVSFFSCLQPATKK